MARLEEQQQSTVGGVAKWVNISHLTRPWLEEWELENSFKRTSMELEVTLSCSSGAARKCIICKELLNMLNRQLLHFELLKT